MNARAVLERRPAVSRRANAARWTTAERIVLTCVITGLLGSFVALTEFLAAMRAQATSNSIIPAEVLKTPLYYAAHAAQIALLVTGGVIALHYTNPRLIEPGYLSRFALFLGAGFLMTVRGYSLAELLSTKLVDSTGPFVCLISLLVFVGARRKNWRVLNKVLAIMAVLFSTLAMIAMAHVQGASRAEATMQMANVLNILYWPAAWLVLKKHARNSIGGRLRFFPIAIYALGSVFVQTRLNIVMLFGLLLMYTYLQRKRRVPQSPVWIIGIGLTVWVSLATAVFFSETRAFRKLEDAATAFSERLDEDTRTGQLQSFMESVGPSELVLGRGAMATWQWGAVTWRGGTDIGYLTLLLYGGVPLLVTYILVHIRPSLAVLRRNPNDWQVTAAAIVLLWSLRMFSSSYPGMTLEYYPVLFCVGACISREVLPTEALRRGRHR
ncbi:MAG TPA: hypothetical protein VN428_16050 [Bryobacteraceae bacterium]|nr:hypothetical protein [Bryobacteraceae bacterium]